MKLVSYIGGSIGLGRASHDGDVEADVLGAEEYPSLQDWGLYRGRFPVFPSPT